MNSRLLALLLLAPGCATPTFETPAEIAELCASSSLQAVAFDVFIDDREGCDWDAAGNVPEDQGVYTARQTEVSVVDGLENTVLCSLDFDFNGDFEYDDDFFLTWNQAILVANRGAVVDEFSEWGRYPLFDWDDIVELDMPGGFTFSPFCAGEDDGDADCEVPRESNNGNWSGDLEYNPDPEVVHELAFRAQSLGMIEVGLTTTGDNDEDDCRNTELDLEVTGTGVVFN